MLNFVPPFESINSVSVTGATVTIGTASAIKYIVDPAVQFIWSGSPVTTFYVQTSQNYNPGYPQSAGTYNAGNWDSLTLSPVPTTSSGSSYTVNMTGIGLTYMRVLAVTSSGSGFISAYFSGKSSGG